jgi:TATA-box binding protein (TBP) (component of TFIID and TFIIIB)
MTQVQSENYDIDDAWDNFLEDGTIENNINEENDSIVKRNEEQIVPKGTEIYISTKTKIAFLSDKIDLQNVFWKIDVAPYHVPTEGVIKKQMKFNFVDKESVDEMETNLVGLTNVDQFIITQIINPSGRIKFKDIRKVSIGLSNKDITSYRSKKKSAFYNCFVLIMRIKEGDNYKEIHVKVFNTGKLEIPGIRTNETLTNVLDLLIKVLKPLTNNMDLSYDINKCETVLINSNFNCGFYINRDKLLDILKYKYKIDCIFDACQYPGIQCKYHHKVNEEITYKVSFMIFRTGSILIVGKCDEDVLHIIYDYIKNVLRTEYCHISIKNVDLNAVIVKKKKVKKKVIYIE